MKIAVNCNCESAVRWNYFCGCFVCETITTGPGDDLKAVAESAANGDVIGLEAGRYNNVGGINAQRNLTLMGIPFEES